MPRIYTRAHRRSKSHNGRPLAAPRRIINVPCAPCGFLRPETLKKPSQVSKVSQPLVEGLHSATTRSARSVLQLDAQRHCLHSVIPCLASCENHRVCIEDACAPFLLMLSTSGFRLAYQCSVAVHCLVTKSNQRQQGTVPKGNLTNAKWSPPKVSRAHGTPLPGPPTASDMTRGALGASVPF